jgi:adhesin HecA-like repeat protein
VGATATKLVDIHSANGITIAPTGSIVSDSVIYLTANGKIESATGSDQLVRARLLRLRGTEISLDQLDVAQSNFQSEGDVRLQADSQLFLSGENQAADISLTVNGLLGNTAGTTIQGDSLKLAAESIWLANASATDQLLISGQAIFSAANSYAIVGDLGDVKVGRLNFNAFHTNINLTSNMYLFGNSIANFARLSSNDYISDAAGAQIRVVSNAIFTTRKGVYLADNANDVVSLCGHTVFDVGDFAFVNPPGTVEMSTWEVLNGAHELVVPDSIC